MKKFLLKFSAVFLFSTAGALAQEVSQYPNVGGNILFQVQADRVLSSQKNNVPPNNAFVYVESNFGLNFNKNWALKTNWRLQPNDVLTTRDPVNPERYRTFLSSERGLHLNNSLLIEELKMQFQNEDMRFSAGKFDPTFGTAHNKAKRIGVFAAQFAEDYNLREKLGFSLSALLENSKITANSFVNDTTALSGSALVRRRTANDTDGIAGNTSTLASYSISIDGKDLFGIEDLSYNAGYRSLGVQRVSGREREKGYVIGAEYLYPLGGTSLIPFVEFVKINNFTGEQGRNAKYSTWALIAKYSSWTGSASFQTRNIQSHLVGEKNSDMMQLSVGYKFTNNITLDVSRANIKEDGYSGSLMGISGSYLYQF